MAINSALNAPVPRLIIYLQERIREGRRKELLVVPVDIINPLLDSPVKTNFTTIRALVNLFDGYNKGNCSRLDVVSFHCVLHVLLTVRPGPDRERGLYLFLESLRQVTDITTSTKEKSIVGTSLKRKTVLAQKSHKQLFEIFSSDDTSLPRRWAGELLLEFIRDSEHNKLLLTTSLNENLRSLGRILLTETDYSLSIVAGAFIREMLDAHFDASLFWPADTVQSVTERFLSTRLAEPNWMRDLFEFLQSLQPQGKGQIPERTIMTQSLDIQGLEIATPSVSPVGLVLDNPIKFLVVKDGRLNFVEMPIKAISSLELLSRRIIFRLRNDGRYVANGLSRWVGQVLVDASDAVSAFGAAAVVRKMMASPLEAIEKRVRFAPSESPAAHLEPADTRNQPSQGASAFLELPSTEEAAERDNSVTQPVPQSSGVQTSRVRRQISFATLELPTREQVVKDSETYLKSQSTHTGVDNQNPESTEEVTHVRSTESPVALAEVPDGEAGQVSEARRMSTDQQQKLAKEFPETVPDSGGQSSGLPIAQDSLESEELQVDLSSDGRDHGVGSDHLPLLAQEALRLQHPAQPSPPTVEEPEHSLPMSDRNSPPTASSVVHAQKVDDKVDTTMALDASEPTKTTLLNRENEGHLETQRAAVEEKKLAPNTRSASAQKSRLKRPHHKLRRVNSRKRSVDWYQDLRVDEGLSPPASKKTKQRLADQTPITVNKSKNPLPSAEKSLALSTHISAPPGKTKQVPSSKKRVKRRIAQTIASTRRSRKAAVKAKEKLAITKEQENIAYDPDDPIECSSQAMPDASKSEVPKDTVPAAFGVPRDQGAQRAVQADPQPLDLIPAAERQVDNFVNGPEKSTDVEPSTELHGALNGKSVTTSRSAGSKPSDEASVDNNSTMVHGPSATYQVKRDRRNTEKHLAGFSGADSSKSVHDREAKSDEASVSVANEFNPGLGLKKLTDNIALPIHGKDAKAPVVDPRRGDNRQPPGPQNISALSQKVSQFISRQQVINAHYDVSKGQRSGRKESESQYLSPRCGTPPVAVQQEIADDEEALRETEHDSPASRSEGPGEDVKVSEQGKEVTHEDGNLVAQDERDEVSSERFPSVEQNNASVMNDSRIHEDDGAKQGMVDPGTVTSPIRVHTSNPKEVNGVALSEASTLVLKSGMDSSPIRPSDSSSLCELNREEFSIGHPPESSPGSSTSSVGYRKSPCPKGRVAPEPKTAGLNYNSNGKEKIVSPTTPSPTAKRPGQARLRALLYNAREPTASGVNEDVTSRGGQQNTAACLGDRISELEKEVNLSNVTKEAVGDGTNTRTMAPAPSAFVERLKAARNFSQQSERTRTQGRRQQRLSDPFESSNSDLDGQTGDLSSQADTQTTAYTQKSYSSDYASQEASVWDAESYEDPTNAWQKALRTSQRTSLDILLDTSHRLIRAMVDEEKAIAGVVDTYEHGCNRIFDQMVQAHDENLEYVEVAQGEVRSVVNSKCKEALGRLDEAEENYQSLSKISDPKSLAVEMEKQTGKLHRQIDSMVEGL